jgi:hypothetical protein
MPSGALTARPMRASRPSNPRPTPLPLAFRRSPLFLMRATADSIVRREAVRPALRGKCIRNPCACGERPAANSFASAFSALSLRFERARAARRGMGNARTFPHALRRRRGADSAVARRGDGDDRSWGSPVVPGEGGRSRCRNSPCDRRLRNRGADRGPRAATAAGQVHAATRWTPGAGPADHEIRPARAPVWTGCAGPRRRGVPY